MEHVKESLSAYIDKELPEEELRRVDAHLSDCAECRGELEELKSLSKLVSGLPQEPLPAGFMSRLERRRRAGAEPAEEPKRDYWLLPFPARVAAFALSSLVVGFVVWDRFQAMFPAPQSMISGAASSLDDVTASKEAAERPAELARVAAAPKAVRERRALAKARGEPFAAEKFAQVSGALSASRGAAGGSGQATGAPVGEPMPKAQPYTNEALQQDLESHKARMKMRILPHQPRAFNMGTLAGTGGANVAMGDELQMLTQAPAPAMVPGATPVLLGDRKAEVSQGAPLAEESAAKEEGAAIPVAVVLRSDADKDELWRKKGIKAEAPAVDYSQEMLLVVWSAASRIEIAEVQGLADKLVVKFRELPAAAEPAPSYQFRVVAKSELPVVLQKLP